jgi:hypothetical protein
MDEAAFAKGSPKFKTQAMQSNNSGTQENHTPNNRNVRLFSHQPKHAPFQATSDRRVSYPFKLEDSSTFCDTPPKSRSVLGFSNMAASALNSAEEDGVLISQTHHSLGLVSGSKPSSRQRRLSLKGFSSIADNNPITGDIKACTFRLPNVLFPSVQSEHTNIFRLWKPTMSSRLESERSTEGSQYKHETAAPSSLTLFPVDNFNMKGLSNPTVPSQLVDVTDLAYPRANTGVEAYHEQPHSTWDFSVMQGMLKSLEEARILCEDQVREQKKAGI